MSGLYSALHPPRVLHPSRPQTSNSVADEPPRISVCIVCRNEADRLGPCLASATWADEIIVMDLSSTDQSAAVAKEYGARVITRAPVPIVELVRNEVAGAAFGEWILALDPDERMSPSLAGELRRLSQQIDLDAIVIPRMNFDLGYPPSHPLQRYEPQLRMYRKAVVNWPPIPNALPRVSDDRVHRLPACDDFVIIHDRSRDITEVLERVLRYAPAQAQSMIDQGQVFTARDMLLTLSEKFYRHFIASQAFRDGVPGILRASILVAFHFYVWAAFWHLSGAKRSASDDRLTTRMGWVLETVRITVLLVATPYRMIKRLIAM